MTERRDNYDGAWIQGGTARIPARGEPFGGPVVVDDTPPEIKEHRKREENKDNWAFRAGNLADVYERNYTAFAEARKTMTLADAKGFTERSLKAYDADVLAIAEGAPSDEARQRFSEDALDLRDALTTRFMGTEDTFQDMKRRSAAGIKAGALSRQAQAYPEDYAMHAAMLDRVVAGAAPLVKPEIAAKFRAVETEKMARSAVMGFIEQGRFDEGRALLATATDADGGPGALPLPPEAVKELSGMLEQRHADAAAREERLDRVDTVIEGTAGPTDDTAEWRDLVEEHFEVAGPQMAELDPVERIGAEDDYVRKLGHLPMPLTRSLRAGMLSGEPGQESAAALRLKTLADHDPTLIEAIPEAERARAAAIAEFAELGLKPERAVELGDERLTATAEALEERVLDLRGQIGGGITDDAKEIGRPDGRPDVSNKKPASLNKTPEVSIAKTRIGGPCRDISLDLEQTVQELLQVVRDEYGHKPLLDKAKLDLKSLQGDLAAKIADITTSAVRSGLVIGSGPLPLVMLEAAGFGKELAQLRQILTKLDILQEQLDELEQKAENLAYKHNHILKKEAELKKTLRQCEEKRDKKNSPDEDKEGPPVGRPMVLESDSK